MTRKPSSKRRRATQGHDCKYKNVQIVALNMLIVTFVGIDHIHVQFCALSHLEEGGRLLLGRGLIYWDIYSRVGIYMPCRCHVLCALSPDNKLCTLPKLTCEKGTPTSIGWWSGQWTVHVYSIINSWIYGIDWYFRNNIFRHIMRRSVKY